jgi:hypothetical protein
MTLRCTSSMRPWHCMHVEGTRSLWIVERGSVCGSTLCPVWQLVHTAVTVRPFWYRPVPWMLSL